ncbi:endo-1,4-beta-xylanase D [Bimuria novae-zelandiae CBS 107.79]|uniref:Endo-1,4-beta-xylanase D n=1 Tax=Bimuria novae-zelandiae CBS 107.79 TaxID=1447943 RepID=A0A6A5V3Y3_9PLEO|nr:endo-1,4-beta-xylanase D [Bimuria novae-zelandiae CBS 107.79]
MPFETPTLVDAYFMDGLLLLTCIVLRYGNTVPKTSLPRQVLNYTTSEAGNPIVDGWYADPDTAIYEGKHWIFPTSSYDYDEQTYLDAFSSPDLINWTKHPNILTVKDVAWAKYAVWAPAPAFRNGKYYLYFGANDLQEDEAKRGVVGGIGVAVADKPQGPYVDAIGKPLIGNYSTFPGAQPIDQDVFIDDDGRAYIYYGGHKHANVAKLNKSMTELDKFEDGTEFKEITPFDYVEGPQMLKRQGKYYLMWSAGGWTGPDYRVSYLMADSPLGPFLNKTGNLILQQDSAVARGSGHNGIIHIPNTDIYYITYHRRPLGETDGNHRVLCYDRLYFNEDGSIEPIKMLVKDNFADGNMYGWKTYGKVLDGVRVTEKKLEVKSDGEESVIVALDTNFADQTYDATVHLTEGSNSTTANAGLLFRVENVSLGLASVKGYYAGLSNAGRVLFTKFSDGKPETTVFVENVTIAAGVEHHVRVRAIGQSISLYVDDVESPVLRVNDTTYVHGANGVMALDGVARFGNVSISEVV